MMVDAYITRTAMALPNAPVDNAQIETVLGKINGKPSRTKRLILRNNGIQQRYYVLDAITRQPTMTNAQLTAQAVRNLFSRPDELGAVDLLACGTTMPDQIAPGHAVMVQGELAHNVCETLSSSGICISGLMALKYAFMAVVQGESDKAVATGSETASLMLRAERFAEETLIDPQALDAQPEIGFDKDFLRWMLSDGAGAVCIEPRPDPRQALNLKIHWIKTFSYAHKMPTCMYAGAIKQDDGRLIGWNQYTDQRLLSEGVLPLKQEVKLLNEHIVELAVVETLQRLRDKVGLQADQIDYFLPHISSMYFYQKVADAMAAMNFVIPQSKWFTNLVDKGNTGSASIYIMLDELVRSGRLSAGEKILCFVPESGRFSSGYMLLEVV
jgi:3-oxoacyl-[acyl-carrier-protein] synthase-3